MGIQLFETSAKDNINVEEVLINYSYDYNLDYYFFFAAIIIDTISVISINKNLFLFFFRCLWR